ncbi:carbohydrate kinase (thermoresistant glucokinase family) [Bradyrhizobium sp. GM24.11]
MCVDRDGRVGLGQEHSCKGAWRASRLAVRGWRQLSPRQQCREDEGRPSAHSADEDRWPWLNAIADEIARVCDKGGHVIIACSALKHSYRDVLLRGRDDVRFVFLKGTQELIADRLAHRKGHFMPPGLLTSQFNTLEPPEASEHVITASIDETVEAIVDGIVRQLKFDGGKSKAV